MRVPVPVLAALAVLALAGCGGRGVRTPATGPAALPSPAPAAVPTPAPAAVPAPAPAPAPPAEPLAKVSAADKAYASGVAAMEEGHHERALEMFAAAWKESPGHAGAAKDFPEALIALKNSGDEALKNGRLDEAGRRWSAALRFISHPAEKGKAPPFTKADLKAGIDRLSENLMEKGLMEYRKGNLEAAIALWRGILSYDPSHAEAARSVQTASTQLDNLKKIVPPK